MFLKWNFFMTLPVRMFVGWSVGFLFCGKLHFNAPIGALVKTLIKDMAELELDKFTYSWRHLVVEGKGQ